MKDQELDVCAHPKRSTLSIPKCPESNAHTTRDISLLGCLLPPGGLQWFGHSFKIVDGGFGFRNDARAHEIQASLISVEVKLLVDVVGPLALAFRQNAPCAALLVLKPVEHTAEGGFLFIREGAAVEERSQGAAVFSKGSCIANHGHSFQRREANGVLESA